MAVTAASAASPKAKNLTCFIVLLSRSSERRTAARLFFTVNSKSKPSPLQSVLEVRRVFRSVSWVFLPVASPGPEEVTFPNVLIMRKRSAAFRAGGDAVPGEHLFRSGFGRYACVRTADPVHSADEDSAADYVAERR
jgi:hypothetical protein